MAELDARSMQPPRLSATSAFIPPSTSSVLLSTAYPVSTAFEARYNVAMQTLSVISVLSRPHLRILYVFAYAYDGVACSLPDGFDVHYASFSSIFSHKTPMPFPNLVDLHLFPPKELSAHRRPHIPQYLAGILARAFPNLVTLTIDAPWSTSSSPCTSHSVFAVYHDPRPSTLHTVTVYLRHTDFATETLSLVPANGQWQEKWVQESLILVD
ncbi:hypothetical protein EIP91_004057 [Steccherinum ochraceum]|uniref:Uncharacterized protein n=1 Tax=Steccherinum ochraceum TaxID=92696 RepID=A0A4R0RCM9_9APHY|nr:hypothetical protein EIP91_004057 [Steccherinum ochraceum]